jgi:hypothetical protein
MYSGGRLLTALAPCSCRSPGNFSEIDSLRRLPNESFTSGMSRILVRVVSCVSDRRLGFRNRYASLSGATMGVKSGLVFFLGNASFMQQPSPQQYFSKYFVPLPSPSSLLISDEVEANVVLALLPRPLAGLKSSGSLSNTSSPEPSCASVMGVEGVSEWLSSSVVAPRLSALERVESVRAYWAFNRGDILLILCETVGSAGIGLSG